MIKVPDLKRTLEILEEEKQEYINIQNKKEEQIIK